MESPPQFPGAPKKSKTGCIIGGIALALVLCCCGGGGALFYFGRGVFGKAVGMVGCSVAMGFQRDGLLKYAEAHGGKLPPAKTWQNDIARYATKLSEKDKEGTPFAIAASTDDYCDKSAGTSIVYNAALAGKKVADVKSPYETIALFEASGLGRNKSMVWKEQAFESSPILLQTERRGWIRQPLSGEPSIRDKRGRVKPVPTGGSAGFKAETGE